MLKNGLKPWVEGQGVEVRLWKVPSSSPSVGKKLLVKRNVDMTLVSLSLAKIIIQWL